MEQAAFYMVISLYCIFPENTDQCTSLKIRDPSRPLMLMS